jgi:hypothetical protein
MVLRKYTDKQVQESIQAALQRARIAVPGEQRRDVLVMMAGLHDAAFSKLYHARDADAAKTDYWTRLFNLVMK